MTNESNAPTDQAAPERITVARRIGSGRRDVMGPERTMSMGYVDAVEYIRVDLAAPSAPAEVEGLVERLRPDESNGPVCPFCGRDPYHYVDIGVGYQRAAVECCDLGINLFQHGDEQLSEIVDRMAEAATALTAQQAEIERLTARAEKAESERDAWKDNAETLAEAVSPFADVGVPSDPMSRINLTADREFVIAAREALATHAKLKGEV